MFGIDLLKVYQRHLSRAAGMRMMTRVYFCNFKEKKRDGNETHHTTTVYATKSNLSTPAMMWKSIAVPLLGHYHDTFVRARHRWVVSYRRGAAHRLFLTSYFALSPLSKSTLSCNAALNVPIYFI